MKTLERKLAEEFTLGQLLAGDVPDDKNFDEILEELRTGENEDYGMLEIFEGSYTNENYICVIKDSASDLEQLLNHHKEVLNEQHP